MSDIRLVAKAYIDAGWQVVPLVKGEKKAATRWQKTVYAATDFKTDEGIAGKCGEPSGWRVDVDCDASEAVTAAKLLLPGTGLVHGRPGKPDSHYWYICEHIKTTQFTDVKDTAGKTNMLVEIRSTGGYTALPPSEHPKGDVLAWTIERQPLTIEEPDLYAAVRHVAIASLLARHWPGPGARHGMVGHLAGFLLQGGLDEVIVVQIIKAAATIASDPDISDREKFARNTCAKFKAGDQVTGGPKLADAIGADVVAKMRGWLRLADIDALEEMNARHFFTRMGTKSVIGREDDRKGVVFQPVRELYSEYQNRKVQVGCDKDGNPTFKPLFEVWMGASQRRQYLGGVVMAAPPRVASEHEYNLWRGFALEPTEGDCSLFLAHLHDIVCSGNDEHYRYLIKWCAYAVQQPGTPPGVAVVMRGKPGTGKGTVVRVFERIFGKHHCAHLDRTKDLVDFNALISGKVIVFADEAFFAGDKQNLGALKRLITEPTTRISRKHIDSYEEDNNLHLLMATNERWAVHAQPGERRFFALDVSDAQQDDRAYFNRIYEEMDRGGAAAFLRMLQQHPVTAAEIRDCPKTEALRAQQDQSLDPHMMWWQECLDDGAIGLLTHAWGEWQPVTAIYDIYVTWCKNASLTRHLPKIEFGKQMSTFLTARTSTPPTQSRKGVRCWELRGLEDARNVFDAEMRTQREWPDLPSASCGSIPF